MFHFSFITIMSHSDDFVHNSVGSKKPKNHQRDLIRPAERFFDGPQRIIE